MSINCCVKIWWNLALINSTSVKLLNTFQVRLCVEKVNSRQERLLKICSISVSDHRQVVGLKLGCWTESLNTSHYKNSSHNERKHRSKIPEHILQNTLKEKIKSLVRSRHRWKDMINLRFNEGRAGQDTSNCANTCGEGNECSNLINYGTLFNPIRNYEFPVQHSN